ncbi:MAG: hypothetical protein ABUK01_04380 [Leptospirales bacterium]
MKSENTSIIIRPAARGGKFLGPDAANENKKSAVIIFLNPETEDIVGYGVTDTSNPNSAGPKNIMDSVSRANPVATDDDTVKLQLDVVISEPTVFRVLVFGPLQHIGQARLAKHP